MTGLLFIQGCPFFFRAMVIVTPESDPNLMAEVLWRKEICRCQRDGPIFNADLFVKEFQSLVEDIHCLPWCNIIGVHFFEELMQWTGVTGMEKRKLTWLLLPFTLFGNIPFMFRGSLFHFL